MAKRVIWAPKAIADRIQILDYWYKRLGTKQYSKKLDTVFKLSQDRDAESYQNIIEELKKQGEDGRAIAAEMEKRTQEVFPKD